MPANAETLQFVYKEQSMPYEQPARRDGELDAEPGAGEKPITYINGKLIDSAQKNQALVEFSFWVIDQQELNHAKWSMNWQQFFTNYIDPEDDIYDLWYMICRREQKRGPALQFAERMMNSGDTFFSKIVLIERVKLAEHYSHSS